MSTLVENRAPGWQRLTLPPVWKWLSEAAGECSSACDWGRVFPKCWVLERFCTLRRGWAWRNVLSALATVTLEKKVLCNSFVSLRAVLAESHHSKGLLESADH